LGFLRPSPGLRLGYMILAFIVFLFLYSLFLLLNNTQN